MEHLSQKPQNTPILSQEKRHGVRSRRGCLPCRSRKVKCDERKDECRNCQRLDLICTWTPSASASAGSQYPYSRPTQRSRGNKACERCRQRKTRCLDSDPTGSCGLCQQAGVFCSNSNSSLNDRPPSSDHSDIVAPDASIPERAEVLRLLDAYFKGPHQFCFYTFIHQRTFMQMLDENLLPKPLLLIVLATSLRCLDPKSVLPDLWADACRNQVMMEIFSRISITQLQILLLVQRYEWNRGAHASAWIISAVAVRLAHALQLNVEVSADRGKDKPRIPTTVMETRRRLLWSCVIMESMIDAGHSPLSGLDLASIDVRLPCDERSYQLGLETTTERLNPSQKDNQTFSFPRSRPAPPDQGLSAFAVQLAVLRMQILAYTTSYHPRNTVRRPPYENVWASDSLVYLYERKLDNWLHELPPEFRSTPDGLHHHRSQLIAFLNMHCMFHAIYSDLYRVADFVKPSRREAWSMPVPSPVPPESFSSYCRQGRVRHALSVAEIIQNSLQYLASEPDPFLTICACVAVRVLVIERRRDDDSYLQYAANSIESALDAAVQCARRTAQWSQPLRNTLLAISQMAGQRGYQIDVSDISELHLTSRPLTRAASPCLRTYGTLGSIQRSLTASEGNLTPSPDPIEARHTDLSAPASQLNALAGPNPETAFGPNASDPLAGLYMLDDNPLSPQALQIASGWADGTYDLIPAEGAYDWANTDLGTDGFYDGTYPSLGTFQ